MAYHYAVQNVVRTGDILVLTLTPKDSESHMAFTAGQYAAISFSRSGRPTPMRCFSITSAPGGDELQFAMRVRGRFTQALTGLRPGDSVQVQGPFGDFTIDTAYDRKVVMLAGGIGITPFISMLRNATERGLPVPITLLYANRSSADIPFYDELRQLERRNPNLRVQFYCADAAQGEPGFVRGNITAQNVGRLLRGEHAGSTYFICGPKGFSNGLRAQLLRGGVHETRVVSETFGQGGALEPGLGGISIRALTYGLTAAALVLATGTVMAVDLVRAVPKLAAAQAPASQQPEDTTGLPASDDMSVPAPAAPSRPAPVPAYQRYQPPMSSVS